MHGRQDWNATFLISRKVGVQHPHARFRVSETDLDLIRGIAVGERGRNTVCCLSKLYSVRVLKRIRFSFGGGNLVPTHCMAKDIVRTNQYSVVFLNRILLE